MNVKLPLQKKLEQSKRKGGASLKGGEASSKRKGGQKCRNSDNLIFSQSKGRRNRKIIEGLQETGRRLNQEIGKGIKDKEKGGVTPD